MSKPWYYTIGYPVKVLHNEAWVNGIITNGYRHEDGIITTMTEKGPVWFCETKRESYLKPNIPDDKPWIPVTEQLPEDGDTVWVTAVYMGDAVVKESLYSGQCFLDQRGFMLDKIVTAWKPREVMLPYKEKS
jgi:hypothetical protein